MTNDPRATGMGFPAHHEPHLSDDEATRITHNEDQQQLAAFVSALGMQRPVSTDKAAFLLEHMIKEQMSTDAQTIAAQMRSDHWENNFADDETVELIADRALSYLSTDEGVKLFNFFAKVFAKTSGSMFE
jgi:ADP-ribosylglycohydrolase